MILESFIALSILLAAASGGYAVYHAKQPSQKKRILVGLGLKSSVNQESPTPFYKWGWRKQQQERVWAERIVRIAFDESFTWLSPDDLAFFELCCESQQAPRAALDVISQRVDQIIERTSQIIACSRLQLADILKSVADAPEDVIRGYFRNKGAPVEKKLSRAHYGRLRLQEWMNIVARDMIGLHSEGWTIHDANGNALFCMSGLDAIRFWAKVCETNLPGIAVRGLSPVQKRCISEVKRISIPIFHEYTEDTQKCREFISHVEQTAPENRIQFSLEPIEHYGQIFCHWLYSPRIQFTRDLFHGLLDFFTKEALSPTCKLLILEKITPKFQSLNAAIQRFPICIIFYGQDQDARQLAATRYSQYLWELRTAFSAVVKTPAMPPISLVVSENDMEECRRIAKRRRDASPKAANPEEDEAMDIPRKYLPYLIDLQKKYSLFEQTLDERTAESAGWIVQIETDDFTAEEYAHLDTSDYSRYLRICCDQAMERESSINLLDDAEAQNRYWDKVLIQIANP